MSTQSKQSEDAALSLTLAVVKLSRGPSLLLDNDLRIIAASKSFNAVFHTDAHNIVGRNLFDLGDGEWNVPQLHSLLMHVLDGEATVDDYEFTLRRKETEPRCVIINAQRLEYLDLDQSRILVSLTDITDDRERERINAEMRHANEILLREIRHRVANSLQIIASVLLQGARKTNSEEAKTHLRSAHSRVMSVAALESQLDPSSGGVVPIDSYLTKLCGSIGSSMIEDQRHIVLSVDAAEATVPAADSVSIGLIVTELVINALKHAFPDGRAGTVLVKYNSTTEDSWNLVIKDNGIGMPPDAAKGGLGTSIVYALVAQLRAKIEITNAKPGVCVSITHGEQNQNQIRQLAV